MKKDFDTILQKEEYTVNRVIERGYEIYDAWEIQKSSSRSITAHVNQIVSVIAQSKAKAASPDVLALLFALDVRIKKKYHSLWKCIFSYFSWRRETQAFKRLKGTFSFADAQEDIRTLLEIEIQKLQENIEPEEEDDYDDQTHGGKHNGKAEEEPTVAEESGEEQTVEDRPEELLNEEREQETAEEKTEGVSEQILAEEAVEELSEELGNQTESNNTPTEDPELESDENTEQIHQEEIREPKEENNGFDQESEPNTDKTQETKTYNDAVDVAPQNEQKQSETKAEQTSFIDEVIMDNMVKGKKDFISHNPLEDVKENREAINRSDDALKTQENKDARMDDHLHDEMMAKMQSDATQQTQQVPQSKTEQTKEPIKNDVHASENKEPAKNDDHHIPKIKEEQKGLREPIQVDITEAQENDLRGEMNHQLNMEQINAIIEGQKEAMREQLNIASDEFLGITDPVKSIEKNDSVQIDPTTIIANRK